MIASCIGSRAVHNTARPRSPDRAPGWYPYGPVTTPYYDEALIREYYQAFVAAGGSARFELLHGVPGDGHLLRLYPDRWRPTADEFLASLNQQRR